MLFQEHLPLNSGAGFPHAASSSALRWAPGHGLRQDMAPGSLRQQVRETHGRPPQPEPGPADLNAMESGKDLRHQGFGYSAPVLSEPPQQPRGAPLKGRPLPAAVYSESSIDAEIESSDSQQSALEDSIAGIASQLEEWRKADSVDKLQLRQHLQELFKLNHSALESFRSGEFAQLNKSIVKLTQTVDDFVATQNPDDPGNLGLADAVADKTITALQGEVGIWRQYVNDKHGRWQIDDQRWRDLCETLGRLLGRLDRLETTSASQQQNAANRHGALLQDPDAFCDEICKAVAEATEEAAEALRKDVLEKAAQAAKSVRDDVNDAIARAMQRMQEFSGSRLGDAHLHASDGLSDLIKNQVNKQAEEMQNHINKHTVHVQDHIKNQVNKQAEEMQNHINKHTVRVQDHIKHQVDKQAEEMQNHIDKHTVHVQDHISKHTKATQDQAQLLMGSVLEELQRIDSKMQISTMHTQEFLEHLGAAQAAQNQPEKDRSESNKIRKQVIEAQTAQLHVDKLHAELSRLREQMFEHLSEVGTAQNEANRAHVASDKLREEIVDSLSEVGIARSETNKAHATASKLREELVEARTVQHYADKVNAEACKLREELIEARTVQHYADKASAEASKLSADAHGELNRLKAEVHEYLTEVRTAQSRAERASAESSKLREEVMEARISQHQVDSKVYAEVSKWQEEALEHHGEARTAQSEAEKAHKESNMLREEVLDHIGEARAALDRGDKMRAESNRLREDAAKLRLRLTSEEQRVEQTCDELRAAKLDSRLVASSLQEEMDELERRSVDLRIAREEMEVFVAESSTSKQDLHTLYAELARDRSEAEGVMSHWREKAENSVAECVALEDQAHAAAASSRAEVLAVEAQMDRIRQESEEDGREFRRQVAEGSAASRIQLQDFEDRMETIHRENAEESEELLREAHTEIEDLSVALVHAHAEAQQADNELQGLQQFQQQQRDFFEEVRTWQEKGTEACIELEEQRLQTESVFESESYLAQEVNELQTRWNQAESVEVEWAQQELAQMQAEKSELSAESVRLQSDLLAKSSDAQSWRRHAADVHSELEKARSEQVEASAEGKLLRQELTSLKEQLNSAQAESNRQDAERLLAERWRTEAETSQQDAEHWHAEVAKLEEELDSAHGISAKLARELRSSHLEVDELSAQVVAGKASAELRSPNLEAAELSAQLASLRSESEARQEELESTHDILKRTSTELENAQSQVGELAAQLKSSRSEIRHLQETVDKELPAAQTEAVEALSAAEESMLEVERLQRDLSALRKQEMAVHSELADARSEASQRVKHPVDLQSEQEVAAAKAEAKESSAKVLHLQREIKGLDDQVRELQEQLIKAKDSGGASALDAIHEVHEIEGRGNIWIDLRSGDIEFYTPGRTLQFAPCKTAEVPEIKFIEPDIASDLLKDISQAQSVFNVTVEILCYAADAIKFLSPDDCQKLAQCRADLVADGLIKRGVAETLILARGLPVKKGAARPAAPVAICFRIFSSAEW